MSIFSPDSPFDPLPWLKEKTVRALADATRLVDLANEPDTTPWYAKRLRALGESLIGRLAPITALVHGAGQEAASQQEWRMIVHGGTFGLDRWCKKWGIEDPTEAAFAQFAGQEQDEDTAAEDVAPADEPRPAKERDAQDLRLALYGHLALRMLDDRPPEAAKRLLAWLLHNLQMSPHADVAGVSRRFLPTDIGCSPEDTADAYRALYEMGLIERVDGLPNMREDALALRLVVEGLNDSKHPAPYRPETFGFPGARVGGKPTIGNVLHVPLPDAARLVLPRAGTEGDPLAGLREHLQAAIGEDRVFIQEVQLGAREGKLALDAVVRYPAGEDDREVEEALARAAEAWVHERMQK